MRFVIYGAGGIGCAIGARLFEAEQDVLLIARGAHLEATRATGLRFITPTQDVRLRVPVVGHPAEAGLRDGDVVMLCVKSHQTEAALRTLRDVAGDELPVVCCQNGVANERGAIRRFRRVYGMVVVVPAEHLVPGEVVHAAEGPAGVLDIGKYPTGVDATAKAVAAALAEAGFSSRPDAAIMRQKYAKLLANLGNAVQAACHEVPREIMRLLRSEALECYAAAGIDCATAQETRERLSTGIRALPVAGREGHRGSTECATRHRQHRNGLSQRRDRAAWKAAQRAHAGQRRPATHRQPLGAGRFARRQLQPVRIDGRNRGGASRTAAPIGRWA